MKRIILSIVLSSIVMLLFCNFLYLGYLYPKEVVISSFVICLILWLSTVIYEILE